MRPLAPQTPATKNTSSRPSARAPAGVPNVAKAALAPETKLRVAPTLLRLTSEVVKALAWCHRRVLRPDSTSLPPVALLRLTKTSVAIPSLARRRCGPLATAAVQRPVVTRSRMAALLALMRPEIAAMGMLGPPSTPLVPSLTLDKGVVALTAYVATPKRLVVAEGLSQGHQKGRVVHI